LGNLPILPHFGPQLGGTKKKWGGPKPGKMQLISIFLLGKMDRGPSPKGLPAVFRLPCRRAASRSPLNCQEGGGMSRFRDNGAAMQRACGGRFGRFTELGHACWGPWEKFFPGVGAIKPHFCGKWGGPDGAPGGLLRGEIQLPHGAGGSGGTFMGEVNRKSKENRGPWQERVFGGTNIFRRPGGGGTSTPQVHGGGGPGPDGKYFNQGGGGRAYLEFTPWDLNRAPRYGEGRGKCGPGRKVLRFPGGGPPKRGVGRGGGGEFRGRGPAKEREFKTGPPAWGFPWSATEGQKIR